MALFDPPIGKVNAILLNGKTEDELSVANADTLDGMDSTDFATTGDIESISKLSYITPQSGGNPYLKWVTPHIEERDDNVVKITSYTNGTLLGTYGKFDNHFSDQAAELETRYTLSESTSRCMIYTNGAYAGLLTSDDNGTLSTKIEVQIDDGANYAGGILTPSSLSFSDGDVTLAEFATTGVTIGGNHVPVYYGSLASAPTSITAGDEYYNTGDSKFYKYNGTDWIALN